MTSFKGVELLQLIIGVASFNDHRGVRRSILCEWHFVSGFLKVAASFQGSRVGELEGGLIPGVQIRGNSLHDANIPLTLC